MKLCCLLIFFYLSPPHPFVLLLNISCMRAGVLSVLLTLFSPRPRMYLPQNGHFIHISWQGNSRIKKFFESLLRSSITEYYIYSDIFLDASLLFECDPQASLRRWGHSTPLKIKCWKYICIPLSQATYWNPREKLKTQILFFFKKHILSYLCECVTWDFRLKWIIVSYSYFLDMKIF